MANAANIQTYGNPLSPGWTQRNLATVKAPNGQSWQVHKAAAPYFEGFLKELAASGYNPISSGGYNYRNIRGGNRLSQHAFGNAVDINAARNPLGSNQTDLPGNVGEIAAKYNLEWGGNWKGRKDNMHFEFKNPEGKAYALPEDLTGGPGGTPTTNFSQAQTTLPAAAAAAPSPPVPEVAATPASPLAAMLSGLGGMAQGMMRSQQQMQQPQVPQRSGPVGLGGPQYAPLAPQFEFGGMATPRSATLAQLLAGG